MPKFLRPDIATPATGPSDPRVGHLLGTKARDPGRARVVLVGFPSDEGVHRGGGRVGAAGAPDEIRRMLYRLTPDAERWEAFVELIEHAADLGNLVVSDDVERDQELLAETLAPYLEAGVTPIVLGGGHETSLGHFLAYARIGRRVGILNWDSHPDVRELREGQGHSGSPFRQAVLHPSGACRQLTAAGLLPHVASRAHLEFIVGHGGQFVWRRDLTVDLIDELYEAQPDPLLVSFDLDAVEQASAPGVSSPSIGGVPVDLWLHAAYRAGATRAVASFDLVEMNPVYDQDFHAARLAAVTVWHFLRGLTERDR